MKVFRCEGGVKRLAQLSCLRSLSYFLGLTASNATSFLAFPNTVFGAPSVPFSLMSLFLVCHQMSPLLLSLICDVIKSFKRLYVGL